MKYSRIAVLVFALSCLALPVLECHACNVPVFRYALERWPGDVFEVVVFHRGRLTQQAQGAVDVLDKASFRGEGFGNFDVTMVDLDAKPHASLLKLWQSQREAKPPWMVVRYPFRTQIEKSPFSTPLTVESVKKLIESPARSEIANRIVKGEVAVWVLLESGDKEKDDRVEAFMKEQFGKLAEILQLPELTDADRELMADAEGGPPLGVTFSVLRLSRNDPRELALVNMLLDSEDDLRTFSEPIVFPVFGRGRALYALVGDGINEDNVTEGCAFLVGPCSCQAKALNPGTDLLMHVDWESGLFGEWTAEEETPSVIGVPSPEATSETASAQPDAPAAETESGEFEGALVRNTVVVLAVGLGVVIAAAVVVLTRRRSPHDSG